MRMTQMEGEDEAAEKDGDDLRGGQAEKDGDDSTPEKDEADEDEAAEDEAAEKDGDDIGRARNPSRKGWRRPRQCPKPVPKKSLCEAAALKPSILKRLKELKRLKTQLNFTDCVLLFYFFALLGFIV